MGAPFQRDEEVESRLLPEQEELANRARRAPPLSLAADAEEEEGDLVLDVTAGEIFVADLNEDPDDDEG